MYNFDKKISTQDFPVIKDYGDNEMFFRLNTEKGEVRLPKLPFQKDVPLPDTLNCRIIDMNGDLPILSHNMPQYVSEFYADGFSKGEEFEFKVIAKPSKGSGFYKIEDSNGLIFKIQEHKSALAIGQLIKCKFEVLDPNVFILRRSVSDKQITMITLKDIAKILSVSYRQIESIENLMRTMPDLDEAMKELDHGLSTWPLTAARSISTLLPKWFPYAIEEFSYDTLKSVFHNYRKVLLYILEGSGYLRNIKGAERSALQDELTHHIEQIDIYSETIDIIRNREQKEFIDNLLSHLKESGYIFHPNTRFAIMMILFRTSPELVNSSLGSIFDALMGWYPDTWKAEPFRQAFVEQLEIYISESRDDIDNFLLPETDTDNAKIEKLLTAIAIQRSLAIDADKIDMRLNMALFYRCLSLLRRTKADTLLNKSYLELMGVKLPTDFTWNDIKEPTMMMTRAAVDPPANASVSENNNKYYLTDKVEIEVGPNLSIRRLGDNFDALVPNGMLPWLNMQVFAEIEHPLNPRKIKSLDGHAEFWNEIEQALFQPKDRNDSKGTTKLLADVDDIVKIEIDRIIPSATNPMHIDAFHCKIVDDHFQEGEGIMLAEDLVSYNLHGVTAGVFRNDQGQPLQFEAKVIEVDANENLRFSLIETAQLAVRDLTYSGDHCYAVVTKDNGRSYSAISERGFGLYINKQPNDLPFHCGNVVLCTITDFSNNTVQAIAEEGPVDGIHVNNALALHNLLKAIAVNDDNEDRQIDLDDDEMASADDLREIAQTIRYKAVAKNEDIIGAFDYLSFAYLIARTIKDEELAREIKAHKEILLLHQYYAKNKTLFRDDIDTVLTIAPDSVLIQRMSARLQIVSCLGHPEDNTELWSKSTSSSNDMVKELAKMVLSYNLLFDINHDDATAVEIKDKIARMLNVNSEQRNLKYYGSESQYVEFKSSLVYPARKGKNGISMADPDKQEHEILHIIAGFMNTTGGKLYIGVNDSFYECGLEDDLKFYKLDNSERTNIYRRNIKSLDNIANYLQNLIDRSFNLGTNAGDYAKTYIDDESVKGVIYVKVEPCPHVVTLNDTIYVRHSGKTSPLCKKEEIEQFKADRKFLFKQQMDVSAESNEQVASDEAINAPQYNQKIDKTDNPVQAEELNRKDKNAELLPDYKAAPATSRLRNNDLHEYDSEHFVTPNFYIRFVGEHDYIVTDDEWNIDDSDRLVLAVREDETSQYLLLVYDEESVVKVPMRELKEKRRNLNYSHFGGKRLIFACPVRNDDSLYSIHENSKGTIYERLTPIEEIMLGSMGTTPVRIMEPECEDSPLWEIVPAAKAHEFANIKSSALKRSQHGIIAKSINSSRTSALGAAQAFYSKVRN